MTRFIARTVALADPPDLLAEAGEDGVLWRDEHTGLAAHGTALRLHLDGGLGDPESVGAIRAALERIEVSDDVGLPGCGAVAIGALPFDRHLPGALVVPRRIVGRDGDQGWLTTIDAVGSEPWAPASRDRRGTSPDRFTLDASVSHDDWKAVIADAVEVLGSGDLDKVVLARRVDVEANRDFVISEVLERLVALYPSCMVFSVEGFLGASPELLLRRTGDRIESHPLAGTVARSGDAHADQALVAGLMRSPKTRREHHLVIDQLRAGLEPFCEDLVVPDEPDVLGLRNVSHLGTRITGRLHAGPRPTALELVARLHPTPAVGGLPTEDAVAYMQKVEGFDRGRYAGPVGWVDSRGDGAWAIGIRCAEVSGATARLYAGNGIVVGSDPTEELAETQLKLQALLAALVRP